MLPDVSDLHGDKYPATSESASDHDLHSIGQEPRYQYTTSPHSDYYDNDVASSSNPLLPIRQKHDDSRS